MKDKFIEIYKQYIHRKGADDLLNWLITQDFFTAPASTRYHLAIEGGLCKHSINVYQRLRKLFISEITKGEEPTLEQEETIAIIGLLHDLCKVNFYETSYRNQKIDGEWKQVPYYTCNDTLPYGHGEKSVYIIRTFLDLSKNEALAIRWHMGFSDNDFKAGGYGVGNAFNMCELALLAHIADIQATYIDEKGE